MAHFAKINDQNIVLEVIVISNENAPDPYPESEPLGQAYIADQLGLDGTWLQTSYNGNIRYNFAGIGYTYDATRDGFIAPEPDNAIGFDDDTLTWIISDPEPDPQP
jgi:hypothetical protein